MKLVDVANFTFPNEAAVLESILLAENIEYVLNNRATSFIVPGSGVTISVFEKDKERVLELIKEAGFANNVV